MNKPYISGIIMMSLGFIVLIKELCMLSALCIGIGFVLILTSYGKR